jgi:hypothetical protein
MFSMPFYDISVKVTLQDIRVTAFCQDKKRLSAAAFPDPLLKYLSSAPARFSVSTAT